ncbi:MAG: hypothetical protein HWN67_03305 [Candidatus Helarchaeota archaeon]|nr:hypothetical protein [Candidatus Helarchaeota archaeon]
MSEDEFGAKEDVVLAIKNKLDVDKETLFKLPIDDLDTIFGLIYQDSNVSPSEIAEIIENSDPGDIVNNIEQRIYEVAVLPNNYDEKQDIIAGILVNIHEEYLGLDLKNEIKERLMKIDDINKLANLSQKNLKSLQVALGIRPPIRTQKPISVPSAPESPTSPPFTSPPIQEADTSPLSTPTIPEDDNSAPSEPKFPVKPPPDRRPDQIVAHRHEEVLEKITVIEKIIKHAKVHPETQIRGKEVMKRIHPDRLDRIIRIFKDAKKKERIRTLFDWFVISQIIEEIDVLVTHWQGIQQGAGAYQAAIGMARFDNILDDMSNRDLENFIKRARKAVSDVQESPDINIRIIGVEEIKELALDLFHKYVRI